MEDLQHRSNGFLANVLPLSGVLLICYDLIFLPIEAFEPESNPFMEVMAWVSSCYWLLDIPLSFLVGYPLLEELFASNLKGQLS